MDVGCYSTRTNNWKAYNDLVYLFGYLDFEVRKNGMSMK